MNPINNPSEEGFDFLLNYVEKEQVQEFLDGKSEVILINELNINSKLDNKVLNEFDFKKYIVATDDTTNGEQKITKEFARELKDKGRTPRFARMTPTGVEVLQGRVSVLSEEETTKINFFLKNYIQKIVSEREKDKGEIDKHHESKEYSLANRKINYLKEDEALEKAIEILKEIEGEEIKKEYETRESRVFQENLAEMLKSSKNRKEESVNSLINRLNIIKSKRS